MVINTNTFRNCLAILLFALGSANCVRAQIVEPGATHDQLKALDFFIGSWQASGTYLGKEVTIEVRYEWIMQGNFVLVSIESKSKEDGEKLSERAMIGWEPKSNQIQQWGFGGYGGHGVLNWAQQGEKKWIVQRKQPWTLWDGKSAVGSTEISIVDENTFNEQGTFKVGDEEVAVSLVSKRRTPSEQLPQQARDYLANLVGDWTMTGSAGDEIFEADFSYSWENSGCVAWKAAWRAPNDSQFGTAFGTGILGWDPKTLEIVEHSFWSDGDRNSWRAKFDAQGSLQGVLEGLVAKGTKSLNGKVKSASDTPNSFSWTQLESMIDGEPQPDLKLTFHRDH